MLISVIVKTNQKENSITCLDGKYIVSTKEPSRENKANISVINILAEYLGLPKTKIFIKRGLKSKKKVVEVLDL